ncbi:TlpA family protein disulfide reductase [Fulvivirga sp. M361]|uniref:TlpA family protein disulfide reductase n=1 Tax=Fulvivirga sp. M361 TaxID=2594266 RepID=UPI00117AC36A|nr:TlpA disulfide reductase family protein [Fulvivirga sp. M361]TRX58373.1 TlpA family protein disulfide reductase [Fulvivirga sp. M361]
MIKKITFIAGIFFAMFFDVNAQESVEIIKFDRLESLINDKEGKVKIINFWATWCGPCVKELPHFEAAREEFSGKVSVNLISLDFADQLSKVNRFVQKKALKSDIYLLDEIDYNSWIDKVDKSWTGAIPATLIINEKTGERKFVESELEEKELYSLIQDFLSKS